VDTQKERINQFEKRVFSFAHAIIQFSGTVSPTHITRPIVSQLVRSGTSIGANYMEANAAQSIRDFISKAEIARKEAHETEYWLDLMQELVPNSRNTIQSLKEEVISIYRILGGMCKKSKQRLI